MIPSISVVIPAHRSAQRIADTLAALARQTLDPARFEVVVVLDGADPAARRAIADVQAPFELRVVEQPHSGAAAARNGGAAHARAPLLLFLDDDMAASPGLLDAHLSSHALVHGGVTLGYFHQPRRSAHVDLLADGADLWWAAHFEELARPDHRFTFKDLCTGNVSLHRELFLAAGGFCTEFKGAAGEDYELGVRLVERGARFRFCPEARSTHRYEATLDRILARARDEGRGHVLIARLHPQVFPSLDLARARPDRRTGAQSWMPWAPLGLLRAAPPMLKGIFHVLRALKSRRGARRVFGIMRYCAYWHGARRELGSRSAMRRLLQMTPGVAHGRNQLDLQLPADTEALDPALAATPTDSVRVLHGRRLIGRIAPVAGAEALRPPHVTSELCSRFAHAVVLAHALGPRAQDRRGGPLFRTSLVPRRDRRIPSRSFVGSYDLAHPPALMAGSEDYWRALLLIKDDGRPLGTVRLQKRSGVALSAAAVDAALAAPDWLRVLVRRDLRRRRPEPPPVLLPISVVVCTRDRVESLRRCLASLASLDYPEFEVVVVDNASRTAETREAVVAAGFRYLREQRPGLDWARNCGYRAASFDIVAYTDDDVEVDRYWLRGLAGGFRSARVQCVTGLVMPLELETRAQHLFEIYGNEGMCKGFEPMHWTPGALSPESLIRVDRIGVGANMAFRRSVFEQAGEFDTALDVGTPSGGGGDLDMLHRVLCAGGDIRYAPDALVWHRHRRDLAELRSQIGNNGRAFGVYLLKRWQERRVPRRALAWYVARFWAPWLAGRWVQSLLGRHRLPSTVLWAELRGAASSWLAFLRTYRSDRRLRGDERE